MPETTPAATVATQPPAQRSPAERLAAAVAKVDAKPSTEIKTEAPKPEIPAKPEETRDEKRAKWFADRARQEGELVAKKRAIAAERAKMDAEQKEIGEARGLLESLKKNPAGFIKVAERFGVSYEDMTKVVMAEGKPVPELEVRAVKDELAQWKAEQKKLAESRLEDERKRSVTEATEARREFLTECQDFVASKEAEYPLTKLRNGHGVVAAVVEESWKRNKKWMPMDEAAKLVEAHFKAEREKEDAVLAKAKPKQEVTAAPKREEATPERRGLTELAAETPETFAKRNRTDTERRQAAIARLSATG